METVQQKYGTEKSYWQMCKEEPSTDIGGLFFVCPICGNIQQNGAESTHDIYVCQKCGANLKYNWEDNRK